MEMVKGLQVHLFVWVYINNKEMKINDIRGKSWQFDKSRISEFIFNGVDSTKPVIVIVDLLRIEITKSEMFRAMPEMAESMGVRL